MEMSYKINLPDNYYRLLKDNAYILEKLGYSIAFFDELCIVEICDLSENKNQLDICICEGRTDIIPNNQYKVLIVFSGSEMNIFYNGVRIIIDKLGDEKQRVMLKFGVDGIFFQFEMNDVFQHCDSKEDTVKHWPIKELTAYVTVTTWNSFSTLYNKSLCSSKSVSIWQYHDFAKIRIKRISNKRKRNNINKKVDFEDACTEDYVAELMDVFKMDGLVVSSKMQRFINVVDILIRIFVERMFSEYETYLENYRDFLNNHKLEVLSEFNEKIYELVLEVYQKIAKAESMRADEIQTTDEQIEQVENLLASYQQNGGTQLLKNNQSTDT